MPQVTVELDEQGNPKGSLPEELQHFVDRKFREGFGKGAEKTAAEAKAQLEAEITRIKAEGSGDRVTAEKLKAAELELSQLREADALRDKNFEEAKRIAEERHKKELGEREMALTKSQGELSKRDERILKLANDSIGHYLREAGVIDDVVDPLKESLGKRLRLNDMLEPEVLDSDGKTPALGDDGKTPVTIEGLVKAYVADHPSILKAPGGRGGRAKGGHSLNGLPAGSSLAAAVAAAADEPSSKNVLGAISAIRSEARKGL